DVKKAAESYYAAGAAKNESKVKSMMCAEAIKEAADAEKQLTPEQRKLMEQLKNMPAPKVVVKSATASGDVAVSTTVTLGSETKTFDTTVKFKKESGDWKFCTLAKDLKLPDLQVPTK
ncbi:MAG: hypothetical protein QOF58_1857, partial [Pseudonocardiales bacterium]|nr:hypothetical protein [Pseudonocardiales bacterium]